MTEPLTSFDEANRQWAWDSTSIKKAEACPRRYYYEIIEGWKSPYPSVHLWFGGHYAKALETYHKLTADGTDQEEAIEIIVHQALRDTWHHDLDEDGNPIPGTGGPDTFDHNAKTRENLIRTIIWYFGFFENDHYQTYITAQGKAAVEYSFRIAADDGITFCGHIDRLCVDPQGEIFVHDQKTTGSTISSYYFNQFKPDSQFSMYTFAGNMIYGIPVKGVIIDAVQVAVGFSRYGRAPTYRTDDELNDWYDETLHLIGRIRTYAEDGWFPRNPASCNNYGGCPFRHVCSRPPEVRANFLAADFIQQQRWDPIVPR